MPSGIACLALLIDTHTLIWVGEGNPKLPTRVADAISEGSAEIFVSAVTAYEYADLHHRGRLPDAAALTALQDRMLFEILDFPADLWSLAATLPPIHRDPVDRMLVAHAIAFGMTLVTADRAIHRYPVETLW